MDIATVSISVPREMVPYLDGRTGKHAFEQNAMLLYPFIRSQALSHGRAAEILGVHKLDLIDFYGSMGLPYFDQSVEDLKDELADIRRFEEADK